MSQPNKPTFTVIAVSSEGRVETFLENGIDGPQAHMYALGLGAIGDRGGEKIWARVIVVSEGKVEGKYPI